MKVLVVGGDVIGCSVAWELAKSGYAVTLFERSSPGAEGSGAAAGMLSPLGEAGDALQRDLLVKSWRLRDGRRSFPASFFPTAF